MNKNKTTPPEYHSKYLQEVDGYEFETTFIAIYDDKHSLMDFFLTDQMEYFDC